MRGRCSSLLPLALLALGLNASCGKRADPLPPFLKTPLPPAGFAVAQTGNEIEIRITAPRSTTESRPLPIIELEWLEAPPTGDFAKQARPLLREEVAPGELRIKRFPIPQSEVRFTVRAHNGGARSTLGATFPFKPAAVPSPPSDLQLANTTAGIELSWTNPPGAEPWPTPSPSATPTPSPAPLSTAAITPPASPPTPSLTPTPTPTATPSPASGLPPPSGVTPVAAAPSPSPTPLPTPTSLPPTGIRIFRTDGEPRLVKDHLQAGSWSDTSPLAGEKPCYTVRYATSFVPLVESAPTEPVCVEVKDLIPPAPPGRLVGDIGADFVELSWLASPSADVAFYRLYRTTETMPRALVIQTEGLLLRVRDANVTKGPRTYEVVAVDQGGNESAPSPVLRIIVP